MIRFALLVCGTLLSLWVAPLGAQAGVAERTLPRVPPLPARLGSFTLVDSTRYPDPSAGARFSYADSAQRVRVDVFVYPVPESAGSDSVHLERETGNFVAGLALGPQRGWNDAHEVVTREAIHVEGGGTRVPGRMVVYVMRRRDQAFVSYMHLFTFGNTFVKTRLTLPEAVWRESTAPSFALNLARALATRPQ